MQLQRNISRALLGWLLMPVALFGAEGSFEKTLKVTGPVQLEVTTGSGNIEVRAGTPGTVRVSGRIKTSAGWFAGNPEARVHAIESDPPISQIGNFIRIGKMEDKELARNISISYLIETPAETELKSNTGSGGLVISGLEGPVTATTGSGGMKITDIKSSSRCRSGSGSIILEGVKGHVFAETGSGTIHGEDLGGGIEGGTGSGDIRVYLTGLGPVRLGTGSGDVDVQGVNGSLSIRTGSGDIKAEGQCSGDWTAHTGSGKITVRLPSAASFDVYCRTSSGHIDSAHSIIMQGTIGKGQLRGKVGKGGALVDLQTASGNIQIQ